MSDTWSGNPRARSVLRGALLVLLLSVSVLQRLGVGSTDFTVTALIAMYLLLAVAVLSSALVVSATRLALYMAALAVALSSLMLNEQRSSFPSFLLLVVVYAPFMFELRRGCIGAADGAWICKKVHPRSRARPARNCSVCWAIRDPRRVAVPLHRPHPSGPPWGWVFNTVIPVGGFIKLNGFFFQAAVGLFVVHGSGLDLGKRLQAPDRAARELCARAIAHLLGHRHIGAADRRLLSARKKNGAAAGALLCMGGAVFALLDEQLNLSYTLSRIGEFDSTRSSGYIRYVAPARLLSELFKSRVLVGVARSRPGHDLPHRARIRVSRSHLGQAVVRVWVAWVCDHHDLVRGSAAPSTPANPIACEPVLGLADHGWPTCCRPNKTS